MAAPAEGAGETLLERIHPGQADRPAPAVDTARSPPPGRPEARPLISVVVPCFNEDAVLPAFHRRLSAAMHATGQDWEVVYVNDGSGDDTLLVLDRLAAADPRVALLNLSRNFGKEIAMTAGLDHAAATGAVVVIDADLQDPPELIPDLVAVWREGIDVVHASRRRRSGESLTKLGAARTFYRVMRRLSARVTLPPDSGDFRLMSRRSVDALLRLREHHRFMKGLFAWVGYPSRAVPYDRAPRAAGRTSWTYWTLWNLALEGITSFTVLPLKIATYIGLFTAVAALLFGGQLVVRTLLFGNPVAGYPSLMAVILFMGGVQLMTLGVIGEYLGRVFNEVKQRPLYLVERYLPPAGLPADRGNG